MRKDRDVALGECRIAEQEFLHGVRDDHEFDGLAGDAGYRIEHAQSLAIRGAGIDDDDAGRTHHEAAVADKAAIRHGDLAGVADEGVDALRNFLRLENSLREQGDRHHHDGSGHESKCMHRQGAHWP